MTGIETLVVEISDVVSNFGKLVVIAFAVFSVKSF